MRIVYIAAGAAGSYCGACARDIALARCLIARGHDVLFVPLYTPVRTDGADPSIHRVFYGGVSAWLQQRFALFRRTPRFVDWLLDRPLLLRLVSRFAIDTRPEDLGPMTVSVLRGADGYQRKELDELLRFLGAQQRPHVVNLTNSLLSGIAPALKQRLGVAVACTLQGEESFIAQLGEPHSSEAADLIRRNAEHIDLFVAPSEDYAAEAAAFLNVGRARIRVVRPGIDVAAYAHDGPRVREPFRIGFLSRLAEEKGIDLACDAFRLVAEQRPGVARLAVAGQALGRNGKRWAKRLAGMPRGPLGERVECLGEVDLAGKAAFLRSCSVFCLPSRIIERRAVACIEALAAGVPIVVPGRGAFGEMLALTGGGVAVEPENPRAIADALLSLLDDADGADVLGRAGATGVAQHFSADAMADATLAAYEALLGSSLRT